MADAKHPRHEEALSGVKASRARPMNKAESRRKETIPSTFTTKKVKTLPDKVVASNLEAESSSPLKVDYGLAARTALQNVKQDLATKEVEQWVRSELESTDLRESFNILSTTTKVEDKEEPRKQGLKVNVISGRTFGMTKEGTKIMSIISVAGHQVVKNLSEPSISTRKSLSLVKDKTRFSGSTCCFSVALVTKKHRYFPGICDAAGGKAAKPPIPGLCFQRNSTFLYSLLKSAANAVLKLMSAVIAIAHVIFVSMKSLSVSIMLLEYSFGKLKYNSTILPMSGF